jgi:hypothetical protein
MASLRLSATKQINLEPHERIRAGAGGSVRYLANRFRTTRKDSCGSGDLCKPILGQVTQLPREGLRRHPRFFSGIEPKARQQKFHGIVSV